MNDILAGLEHCDVAFIDDTAIFSNGTWDDDLSKVRIALDGMRTHGVTLKAPFTAERHCDELIVTEWGNKGTVFLCACCQFYLPVALGSIYSSDVRCIA